jgi:hypothetical protein
LRISSKLHHKDTTITKSKHAEDVSVLLVRRTPAVRGTTGGYRGIASHNRHLLQAANRRPRAVSMHSPYFFVPVLRVLCVLGVRRVLRLPAPKRQTDRGHADAQVELKPQMHADDCRCGRFSHPSVSDIAAGYPRH